LLSVSSCVFASIDPNPVILSFIADDNTSDSYVGTNSMAMLGPNLLLVAVDHNNVLFVYPSILYAIDVSKNSELTILSNMTFYACYSSLIPYNDSVAVFVWQRLPVQRVLFYEISYRGGQLQKGRLCDLNEELVFGYSSVFYEPRPDRNAIYLIGQVPVGHADDQKVVIGLINMTTFQFQTLSTAVMNQATIDQSMFSWQADYVTITAINQSTDGVVSLTSINTLDGQSRFWRSFNISDSIFLSQLVKDQGIVALPQGSPSDKCEVVYHKMNFATGEEGVTWMDSNSCFGQVPLLAMDAANGCLYTQTATPQNPYTDVSWSQFWANADDINAAPVLLGRFIRPTDEQQTPGPMIISNTATHHWMFTAAVDVARIINIYRFNVSCSPKQQKPFYVHA